MYRAALLALLALAACRQPVEPAPSPTEVPTDTADGPLPDDMEAILAERSPLRREDAVRDSLRGAAARDSLLDALLAEDRTPCYVDDPSDNYRRMLGSPFHEPPPPEGEGTWLRETDTLLVREGDPSVIVEYVHPELKGGSPCPGYVVALRLRRPGARRPFQTLEVGAPFYTNSGAETPDVDGDGYADLLFQDSDGLGYMNDFVWLYRPAERRYGPGMFIIGRSQVDPETGAVWSLWKSGCCKHGLNVYVVRDGRLRHTRQWVAWTPILAMDFEVTAVCERRGRRMTAVEVRAGQDWHDAPGDRE